jgi:hypothetical protein
MSQIGYFSKSAPAYLGHCNKFFRGKPETILPSTASSTLGSYAFPCVRVLIRWDDKVMVNRADSS